MSKEPIYRIKVEVIGNEHEEINLSEELRGGVECSGFVLMYDKTDEIATTAIQHLRLTDVATLIASDGDMMAASLIAKAMRDGKRYIMEDRNPLADLLKKIANDSE